MRRVDCAWCACTVLRPLVVPGWWPAFVRTGLFLLYFLSVPVVALTLLGLFVWGATGFVLARRHGAATRQTSCALMIFPLAGLLMFGSAVVAAHAMRGALPTGSYVLEFDNRVWLDPTCSEFVRDDIAARQKMLGSFVERLQPGLGRAEIEAMLGPLLAST